MQHNTNIVQIVLHYLSSKQSNIILHECFYQFHESEMLACTMKTLAFILAFRIKSRLKS